MDEYQKLNKKAQNASQSHARSNECPQKRQESGHYDVAMIQSNQKGLKNL
ncbi:hypothetical protein QAD60_08320 [Helicobacter pylori]|nr:hypothetical protein [Helicobacter pylori]